jgi:hypothetical protein
MLKKGFIKHSNFKVAAPVLIIPKKMAIEGYVLTEEPVTRTQ